VVVAVDIDEIEQLLNPYDENATECDGHTQICYSVLTRQGIAARIWGGWVKHQCGLGIPLHFWLSVGDTLIVDYRCRMWLGGVPDRSTVPHGVFAPQDYPLIQYAPQEEITPIPRYVLSDALLRAIATPIPEEIRKRLGHQLKHPSDQ
jgi:hypothetical protein